MDVALDHLLPHPGPVWGPYPQRAATDLAPPWRRLRWCSPRAYCRRVARAAEVQSQRWRVLDSAQRSQELAQLRSTLRRDGLAEQPVAAALGCVAALAAEVLGRQPYPTQLFAAAALLDNRMVEMATGEGKTLAVGLAAVVAALAGIPVHAATANDYLAARDAQMLAPLAAAVGLRVAFLDPRLDRDAKRAVYAQDIVYATARELAFDYLRDQLAAAATAHPYERIAAQVGGIPGAAPVLRGLCMAILDEADSILLDEANVPLILSRKVDQSARRAFLWQALALARQLVAGRDFLLQHADRQATLTEAGLQRIAGLSRHLGGPWRSVRYRREAVTIALAALHLYLRDEHYLVREGRIDLLDEVTGRVAVGRVWSRGLHALVEMKEGLRPSAETETLAQITFQRFFLRYWRCTGMSGTLRDAAGELKAIYGARVLRVPLAQRDRRITLSPRAFASRAQLFAALPARVAELTAAGRPVLIGTDSVADSEAVAARLTAAGIVHRVLNARQDADEAAIIAAAGLARCVTVATRMAGRGTDIGLDDAARTAGGLHVLSCQHNPSLRLDRQLAGRAARHGDPGSTESWFVADSPEDARPEDTSTNRMHPDDGLHSRDVGTNLEPCTTSPASAARNRLSFLLRRRWPQWREERRTSALRRALLQQDLAWDKRLAFAGPPS